MFVRTAPRYCSAAAPTGFHFGIRSAFLIPHREKAKRGGEDSFFLHPSGICAADGVGGWASSGVDPAIYTRKLVATAHDSLAASPFCITPQAILQRGVSATSSLEGSCTVITAIMDNSKKRVMTHLVGDCGLLYIRNGQVKYRTEEQQQGFNCPYQLPSNRVSDGRAHIIEDLAENDVFILGSDGLFDNLHTPQIVEVAQKVLGDGKSKVTDKQCNSLSEAIAEAALKNSRDKNFVSPFAVNARKAGYRFQGGKEDDITVVVGIITPLTVDIKPLFSGIDQVEFSTGKSKAK